MESVSAADPIARFSSRVDAYVRARPHYPDAIAGLLLRELALTSSAAVADIGSGTGISCLPFLRAGLRVWGVEPNAPMREASEVALAEFPRYQAVDGNAEATGLADGSVDLAVAGQAFHWFRHAEFRRELMRVLAPDGALALFWNSRRHEASSFMTGYNELLLEYCAEYRAKWKGDDVGAKHAPGMALVFGGRHWGEASLDNAQVLDRAGLIERVESDSYAPPAGDPIHAPMIDALHRLFNRCAVDGQVTLIYKTRLFFGRLTKEGGHARTS